MKKKIYKYFNQFKFRNSVLFNKKNFLKLNNETQYKSRRYSFGSKNHNKIFYVIKRSPGAGLFSNFIFVLKNINYALKKNYIPIVDMKNFPTKYNEKKNIYNTKNIWELYFDQLTNYDLSEVYRSKNVIICSNTFAVSLNDFNDYNLKKIFRNKIKINNKIIEEANKFYKKYFSKNKKVIGIHIRGTDQKITPNHYLPPTIFDIYRIIEKEINLDSKIKFFIITEEKKYLETLKKKFNNKIFYFDSFRANKIREFNNSKRRFHRNKLGVESLKESVVFSYCNKIYYCKSNIPLFSILLQNKIKIKKELFNGINSKNQIFAYYKWYITVLPISFIKYLMSKLGLL